MSRPVKHKDGRTGKCQCLPNSYIITWEDGEVRKVGDISYALAEFTDIQKRPWPEKFIIREPHKGFKVPARKWVRS